jgi:uncharacterized membrane protein (DUF373 family)
MHGEDSRLTRTMSLIIRYVAKITAVIMVFVIIWGVADIVYVLYQRLKEPPFLLLEIKDILATFGAFMAVLIAIEIYHNLVLYVQDNHNSRLAVEIVLATALMAAARKVIVFDYNEMAYHYVYATGAVILALSIAYYYIVVVSQKHAK